MAGLRRAGSALLLAVAARSAATPFQAPPRITRAVPTRAPPPAALSVRRD